MASANEVIKELTSTEFIYMNQDGSFEVHNFPPKVNDQGLEEMPDFSSVIKGFPSPHAQSFLIQGNNWNHHFFEETNSNGLKNSRYRLKVDPSGCLIISNSEGRFQRIYAAGEWTHVEASELLRGTLEVHD